MRNYSKAKIQPDMGASGDSSSNGNRPSQGRVQQQQNEDRKSSLIEDSVLDERNLLPDSTGGQ